MAVAGDAACSYPPTQLLVVVDTDLRTSPLRLQLIVRAGTAAIADTAQPDREWRWAPGREGDVGFIAFPASLGIVPASSDSSDGPVTFSVQIVVESTPPATLRRIVRGQFVRGSMTTHRIFLSAACLGADTRCRMRAPCTLAAYCEESGQTCDRGACVGLSDCSTGRMRCGADCVDTRTDDAHCGRCGSACTSPNHCVGGVCAPDCPAPRRVCGTNCVDVSTDVRNCGTCGTACSTAEDCVSGACRARCSPPLAECSGVCLDLRTSNTNCGACGNACATGTRCTGSACQTVCSAPQVVCAGACVNVQTSSANCGACGRACAAGQSCSAGACVCPTGLTACGSQCVDVLTDTNHCGGCGVSCGTAACWNGRCIAAPAGCDAPRVYGGHLYARCNGPLTWYQATDICGLWGGYLAVVNNSAEDTFLQSLGGGNPWIAYTDVVTEGSWTWLSSMPSGFVNWCPGEPSATCCYGPYPGCPGGGVATDQDCAVMNFVCSDGSHRWDDQNCCWMNPFLCERSF